VRVVRDAPNFGQRVLQGIDYSARGVRAGRVQLVAFAQLGDFKTSKVCFPMVNFCMSVFQKNGFRFGVG